MNKVKLEDTLKRCFFFDTSFSIYGGVSGLYDYGPIGVDLQDNILQIWKSHFVIHDHLRKIKASQITIEPVLKSSGHVDRFTDLMVKDVKTGDCYRLDHLIKDHLEKFAKTNADKQKEIDLTLAKLDGFFKDEMSEILRKYNMKAPVTGNDLGDPEEFNLMFATSIGPTGLIKSYLRPETAQGIFVNFKRLLERNRGRLPFGVAQIGTAFRNEISPRGGLTRLREFNMCEIEYFVDPQNKKHPKYESVKSNVLNLYSACNQVNGEKFQRVSIESAVNGGTIANETLAYFLSRINDFMLKIGMDLEKIRFRQHMSNEMAHYATDCWDCECLTSSGWLECVGCADRSCYDLTQHSKATKVRLTAHRYLKEPKEVEIVHCIINRQLIGKSLRGDSKFVIDKLTNASDEELDFWEKELSKGIINLKINDKSFDINKDMVTIERRKKTIQVEEIVPCVIEPSFGVDRIIYSLLEQNYRMRDNDENRTYFSFPPLVAPIKCSILPLGNNLEFQTYVNSLRVAFEEKGIWPEVDDSSESIGKRYARTDEIGIPFGITIDFDTIKLKTVTLRYCITTEQIRVDLTAVVSLVSKLSKGKMIWTDAKKLWPAFSGQSGDNLS